MLKRGVRGPGSQKRLRPAQSRRGRRTSWYAFAEETSFLGRFFRAVSEINRLVACETREEELMREVCRVLVEQAGFCAACFLFFGEREGGFVRELSFPERKVPGECPVALRAFHPGGEALTRVRATKKPLLWFPPPEEGSLCLRPCRGAALFPLFREGSKEVTGVFGVCAGAPAVLGKGILGLLEELASTFSFALSFFAEAAARHEAEAKLQRAAQELEAIFQALPDIYFRLASDGTILDVKAGKVSDLYLPRELLLGKKIQDVPLHAAGRQAFQEAVAQVREKRSLALLEYSLALQEGRQTFEARFLPLLEDQIIVVVRNITERKEAEEKLKETVAQLRRTVAGTIRAMALAVEVRDPYTAGHQVRVAKLAAAIAQEMGLSREQVENIQMAAAIHDVGKIGIPAEVLSKPGRITELEFGLIKMHPQVGFEILREVDVAFPLAEIVLQHHERLDGSGYPQGLKGEQILLEARIVAVADVVEAMSSHRPYRPAFPIDAALEEVARYRGVLYDPTVVDSCLRLFQENGFSF